jgi:hypothetical protein
MIGHFRYRLRSSPLLALALHAFSLAGQPQCPNASVPRNPPDIDQTVYSRLFADSNLISLLPERSDRQPRNVVLIQFDSTATPRQRQAAIHAVCGRVFGGLLSWFYVQVRTDRTARGLYRVMKFLRSQPGVSDAQPPPPVTAPLGSE